MKKLSKIAQVTFFAAAFAVLFSGTADAYIEKEVNHIGRKYEVHVVTSDSLEQQTIFQRGAVRISSIEFYNLVFKTNEDIKNNSKKVNSSDKNVLLDNIDDDVLKKLEAMRRS